MNIRIRSHHLSPHQVLALAFAAVIAAGTLLVWLPISVQEGQRLSFLDALFTAVSAASVTGLTVTETGTTFSPFGQIVILLLIQAGGIGYMTVTSMIALMLGKRITLRERLVLKEAFNHPHTEGIVRLVRKVLVYSLIIEACGALLFAFHWMNELPFGIALYYGLFHAISVFNNAGFDLVGGFSPFAADLYFNLVSASLIFLGSVGFLVLSELIEYRKTRRLSLHSKVVLSFSGALIAVGAAIICLFEYANPATLAPMTFGQQWLAAFYQSVSLRSSGAGMLPVEEMRQATQFFMAILMFIGAAPGSTGGGIKITTFAVMLAAVYAMLRGRQDAELFRMRIDQVTVYKAITVTMASIILVAFAVIVLCLTEDQPFLAILFEAVSAFSTTGFSMSVTSQLSAAGKIVLILLMFAGRLGPFAIVLALKRQNGQQPYRYPEGKIILG